MSTAKNILKAFGNSELTRDELVSFYPDVLPHNISKILWALVERGDLEKLKVERDDQKLIVYQLTANGRNRLNVIESGSEAFEKEKKAKIIETKPVENFSKHQTTEKTVKEKVAFTNSLNKVSGMEHIPARITRENGNMFITMSIGDFDRLVANGA